MTCGAGADTVYTDASDVLAADCETRLAGPAPANARVTAALADAAALSAHRPNPQAGLAGALGTDQVGPGMSTLDPGLPESYRAIASTSKTIDHVRVRTGAATTATRIVVGIYADDNNHPGQLLTSGELLAPVGGTWNQIAVPATTLTGGVPYWIGVMGTGGSLQIANHDGGTGYQPQRDGALPAGGRSDRAPARVADIDALSAGRCAVGVRRLSHESIDARSVVTVRKPSRS